MVFLFFPYTDLVLYESVIKIVIDNLTSVDKKKRKLHLKSVYDIDLTQTGTVDSKSTGHPSVVGIRRKKVLFDRCKCDVRI
jgi:hypothetical protein